MDNEMISKFDKHINLGKKIKFGDDEFLFKPLEYEDMAGIWKLMSKITEMSDLKFKDIKSVDDVSEEDVKKMLEIFDEDTMTIVGDLSAKMIKLSYPELDDVKAKAFVQSNYFKMFMALLEINLPSVSGEELQKVKLNEHQTENK